MIIYKIISISSLMVHIILQSPLDDETYHQIFTSSSSIQRKIIASMAVQMVPSPTEEFVKLNRLINVFSLRVDFFKVG